jgi:hypothetical protein
MKHGDGGGGGGPYHTGYGEDLSPGNKSQVLKAVKGLERGTPVFIEYSSPKGSIEIGYFNQVYQGDIYLSRRTPLEEQLISKYNFSVDPRRIGSIREVGTGKQIYPYIASTE